ncbi:MAG TPA: HAD-IC family P-type ATPase, partial [Chlamydiales bacterium]|nr:HAD-IC family P-type ATPase [Chlamydiales bacterium]
MEFNIQGLTQAEAAERLRKYGPNSLKRPERARGLRLFFSQFKSPLILLLIGAGILSFSLGGKIDSSIICTIVVLSGLLGFFQERGAIHSLEKLLRLVETKAMVRREGKEEEIPLEQVVVGDIVVLNAGDVVPADCQVIEANRLFVDESTLTGESIPVEKGKEQPLFMGTVVASGVATAVVTAIGRSTKYGDIVEKSRFKPPETAFEVGVRKFGLFLLLVTVILVAAIFIVNVFLHRPVLQSFLFSLALAVGLTPQLLPAIISVNLSHGARKMAQKKVIIKRLASIENFGQMDVLCTDKTGTITMGKIELDHVTGVEDNESEKAAFFGYVNSKMQTAYTNPLDQAIQQKMNFDLGGWNLIDEIPYDFNRKRLSVIVEHEGHEMILVKGAVLPVLSVCNRVELPDGNVISLDERREAIEKFFDEKSSQGFRILAVAYGEGREEQGLILLGFFYFLDPIKPDIQQVVEELKKKGVNLKILSGDYHAVARHIATALNLPHAQLITGKQIEEASDEQLINIVREKNIFAEIEPGQKQRIVMALRNAGHIVGYLGDGVNDIPALHNAD